MIEKEDMNFSHAQYANPIKVVIEKDTLKETGKNSEKQNINWASSVSGLARGIVAPVGVGFESHIALSKI